MEALLARWGLAASASHLEAVLVTEQLQGLDSQLAVRRAAGQALGLDLEGNPTIAANLDVGFRTAAWFWNSHNLSPLADQGDFLAITKIINGGTNGLADREAFYDRAKQVLGA